MDKNAFLDGYMNKEAGLGSAAKNAIRSLGDPAVRYPVYAGSAGLAALTIPGMSKHDVDLRVNDAFQDVRDVRRGTERREKMEANREAIAKGEYPENASYSTRKKLSKRFHEEDIQRAQEESDKADAGYVGNEQDQEAIAEPAQSVVEPSINPLFGAGGGALVGGAGSLLRDYLKSEDPNYKRAALVAILGGAIGYGGTHAFNNYG